MIKFHRPFDPHKIRLLIFDLDGTLIDSRLDLVHSVNATLRHMKRPELPDDVIASYVGDGAPALIGRALGKEASDQKLVRSGLEYFLAYYREHKLDHTHVYEGISASAASAALSASLAISARRPRCSSGTRRFRYSRRSTATCSLRERPVWSRRPASPTRADSSRSTNA